MAEINIQELEWGVWNEAHILEKHGLSRAEIEEVCFGDAELLKAENVYDERIRVIGPKQNNKLLVIILSAKGNGKYFVVTAKQPKRQEIRRYTNWKAEITNE